MGTDRRAGRIAWLAGRWVGEGLGGTAEYLYSPPAYFDGLTYRLDEDGGLEAYVISESDHGTERELAFRFRRAVDSGASTSPEEVLGN